MPEDYYEKYNIPTEYTAEQAIAVRSANGTRGLNCDYMNFRAIMPFMEFENGKLCSLVLHPLEIGFAAGPKLRGYPNLADEKTAKEIYDRLVELSKPYGTKLSMKGDKIIVAL
jgi:poly-gamma-glutamate synthesis protein (capsule biosynthesis protein)